MEAIEGRVPRRFEVPSRRQQRFIFVLLAGALAGIVIIKVFLSRQIGDELLFGSYGILVTLYLLSRMALASRYKPDVTPLADEDLPTITIVVPAMNEGEAITATLEHCLEADYPASKLEVLAIDDGSRDATLQRMKAVRARYGPRLRVVSMPNHGKRFAMAEGFVRSTGQIVVFIDSDSFLAPDALKKLVPYFADAKVGAVTGHTDVANDRTNILTRMQAVRYFAAFRIVKGAEAVFGSVSCCSGCFSGYRREAIQPVLQQWLNQTFADAVSTYGDDRSLTNFILRSWDVLYAPDAQAWTIAPHTVRAFMRQQVRWRKSWLRESVRGVTFMWRRHPLAAAAYYASVALTLMAPVVFIRFAIVRPSIAGATPVWYLGGIAAMSLVFGLYHRLRRRSSDWLYAVAFSVLYSTVMIWQTPYALATLRNNRWGTR